MQQLLGVPIVAHVVVNVSQLFEDFEGHAVAAAKRLAGDVSGGLKGYKGFVKTLSINQPVSFVEQCRDLRTWATGLLRRCICRCTSFAHELLQRSKVLDTLEILFMC